MTEMGEAVLDRLRAAATAEKVQTLFYRHLAGQAGEPFAAVGCGALEVGHGSLGRLRPLLQLGALRHGGLESHPRQVDLGGELRLGSPGALGLRLEVLRVPSGAAVLLGGPEQATAVDAIGAAPDVMVADAPDAAEAAPERPRTRLSAMARA